MEMGQLATLGRRARWRWRCKRWPVDSKQEFISDHNGEEHAQTHEGRG
jgi:hypothetical protein